MSNLDKKSLNEKTIMNTNSVDQFEGSIDAASLSIVNDETTI